LAYAGDNFLRYSGEAKKVSELQSFAFKAAEQGSDINIIVCIITFKSYLFYNTININVNLLLLLLL